MATDMLYMDLMLLLASSHMRSLYKLYMQYAVTLRLQSHRDEVSSMPRAESSDSREHTYYE